MATRRNHYGDGFSYGGAAGGGQYGYGGYGATQQQQHAFPSYSGGRSSGSSKCVVPGQLRWNPSTLNSSAPLPSSEAEALDVHVLKLCMP